MTWIDVIAAVAARRFTGCPVTTLCVDNLTFLEAAYLNDTVVQEACVTWSGRTSLEVRVDTYVERLNGERKKINRAYCVFVALDDNDQPYEFGRKFVPETEEEADEYAAAEARRWIRKNR